jgi:hypothetical protein
MTQARYTAVHLDDIPQLEYEGHAETHDWHPLRIHFGITSFGTNAYTANVAGESVVGEHDESDTQHEELYFVMRGHAQFEVAGEQVDAPAGTFVYVPDPNVLRSAVAEAAPTTVLGFGGIPGRAFTVSEWEQEYDPAAGAS